MNYIRRIIRIISLRLPSIKILGWRFFLLGLIARGLSIIKYAWGSKLQAKHIRMQYSYLTKQYGNVINRCMEYQPLVASTNYIVWIFWWQGYNCAPSIVKKCILSVKREASKQGFKLVLLDKNNFSEYVKLPKIILEKFYSQIMPIQHFSDLIRLKLLTEYGGLWCDATLLLVNPIPQCVFGDFYTATPGHCKWTSFLLAGKEANLVTYSLYELLKAYWENEDGLLDYFILDRFIEIIYEKDERVRQLIDNVIPNNRDIMYFIEHSDDDFSPEKYSKLLSENWAFKLSYKKQIGGGNTISSKLLADFGYE